MRPYHKKKERFLYYTFFFRCDEMCGYVVKSTVKTSQPISYSADNDMKTRCFVMFSAGIKSKSYPRNIVCSRVCRAHKINRSFITHLYIRAQNFSVLYRKFFFIYFFSQIHLYIRQNKV